MNMLEKQQKKNKIISMHRLKKISPKSQYSLKKKTYKTDYVNRNVIEKHIELLSKKIV